MKDSKTKGIRQIREKMADRKWIEVILMMLMVLAVLMAITLFMEGVNPFSKEALSIVGESVETVLNDSGHKIEDVSKITSEESASAVAEEAGEAAAASSSSSSEKSAVKKEEKEEKQTQEAVKDANNTAQSEIDSVIYRIANWLPDWIPIREYLVTFVFLGLLILLIWLLNKYF